MDFEPIAVVGVITDEVGTPSNDGTAGSALYAVPLRLSRTVDAEQARMLEQIWDHPPRFTTMHRPGVARVAGNRFVLNETTVDEVASYHVETLRAVVQQFNADMAKLSERRAADLATQEASAAEHRQHVREVVDEIRFN